MSTQIPPEPVASAPLDTTIDLFDLALRFATLWRRLLLVTLALFAIGAAMIYSIKPLYEASASLLPQGRDDSSNLASFFSGRSPGDIFLGLLASRSVADGVIDRVGLLDLYHTKSRDAARGLLASRSIFAIGRDTLVVIKVRDGNAELAARISNAYLDALQEQREHMLARESEIHSRFFEQQLQREASALAAAEQDLKQTQEKSGLVQPDAQTSIGLNAIASIRSQIVELEVQLASLRLGATDQNPQVKALESQIARLQGQEAAMQSAGSGAGAGAAASARRMPELNLDYARKLRAVKYHEGIFTSISNQYEAARLNDGYTGAPFVVVDRAIVPAGQAWPPRRTLMILAFLFSMFAGITVAGLTLVWRSLMADPIQVERLRQARSSFHLFR